MTAKIITLGNLRIGGGAPLAVIAGPCVIESKESALRHAAALKEKADRVGVAYIFKSSYDQSEPLVPRFFSRSRLGKRSGDSCRRQG